MIFLSILHQESDLLKTILNRWTLQIPTEMAPHRRAVRALLHEMLTKEMQLQRDSYRLVSDGNGRPFLETEAEIPLPGISLSHSGGWIACAARVGPTRDGRDHRPVTISPNSDVPPRSNNVIGLDLERAKMGRDHLALAEAAFGPGEIAAVRAGGSTAFYRIWTLREAWSKATGAGFAGLTDRLDHVPLQLLEDIATSTTTEAGWHWWRARLRPDLHIALVSAETVTPKASVRATSIPANRSTPKIWKCHVSSDLDLDGISFHNANWSSDMHGKPGRDDAAT
ncbi:MAG TPA: 4'-phosphopantetheinyl transferase superfamily protein [Dongiaceae bacterium]|nr:4'-phosphopantetheinyl transferase superfamily protein [Dongiaceae bacterium]